ncbi:MAG TPA: hypothetical protein VFJ48_08555, partial [Casimicrobiaceae bacterium]|nr:hypothetical protein [Casimicrobiaceae bacterium]
MRARHSHCRKAAAALVLGLGLFAASPDGLSWSITPIQVNALDRNDVGALFNAYYQTARMVPPAW